MAREKIATPVLEEFLRQVEPPVGGMSPTWKDWPLAILAFVLVSAVNIKTNAYLGFELLNIFGFMLAIAAACGVLGYRKTIRKRELSQQTHEFRASYERWERVKRLLHVQRNAHLNSHVPVRVLTALERAARAWHNSREELRSLAVVDPAFVADIQLEVDAVMMTAAAAAAPVVRRDDQSSKAMRLMEGDLDLMNMVCRRIDQESRRLQRWVDDTQGIHDVSEASLRERLAIARRERAAAEAELDSVIANP